MLGSGFGFVHGNGIPLLDRIDRADPVDLLSPGSIRSTRSITSIRSSSAFVKGERRWLPRLAADDCCHVSGKYPSILWDQSPSALVLRRLGAGR